MLRQRDAVRLGGTTEATTTDLYEVTMAMSYLREGMRAPATFSLFVRDPPPGRGFLAAAGLEPALDYLCRFRITSADVRQPLLEVTAPLPQAHLVQTYLLTQVCHRGPLCDRRPGAPRRCQR